MKMMYSEKKKVLYYDKSWVQELSRQCKTLAYSSFKGIPKAKTTDAKTEVNLSDVTVRCFSSVTIY